MSEKRQLNLYVEESVDTEFRQKAVEAGHGKKPAPMLETLLAIYRPDFPRLYSRLVSVLKDRPPLTREERFYAEQIRDLLNELLARQ